jgi:long-chain acyl-CoA synthetase
MNYCDVVFDTPEHDAGRCALIDTDAGLRLTFKQLQEYTKRVAGFLIKRGFRRGDVVSIHLYNGVEAVVAHLAVQYAGMVSCMLDPLIRPNALSYYIGDSGSKCLLTHVENVNVQEDIPHTIAIITASQIMAAAAGPVQEYVNERPFSFGPEEPSSIFYTSGTTSKPKGVLLCNKNYLDKIKIVDQFCYHYTHNDRLLCFVPFSHGFGSKFIFLPCMKARATFVTMRSFHPAKMVSLIEREGITGIFGVPSHFQQLVRFPEYFGPLRDLKFAFTAAAVLKPETARKWHELSGYYLDEGYGLIETCTLVTFRKGSAPQSMGDIGYYPKELIDVAIVDENDRELEDGHRGEIAVRGDSVMLGYINRPEETAKALRNGWFHTGDMGFKTSDGRVIMAGRIKDIINIAGIKVSPFEVEDVLNRHPFIDESAVVGVEDGLYGESIHAFVKRKAGATLTEREISKFAQQHLMSFQVPRKILFVDSFARNTLGKIDKKILINEVAMQAQGG